MTTSVPSVRLPGGTSIPQIGLGTWPMNDEETRAAVRTAIEAGYRHVDTAENYENERGVGQGVRDSGIAREEVFVTTKFNKKWHGDAAAGVQANLERLGMDYADLVLIHWPNPDQDLYVKAWETLIELREKGVAKAIGTSNFKPAHIQRLIDETGVTPETNQIECHPYYDRPAERAWHAEHGIVTTSWSPLGRDNGLRNEKTVTDLAERYGVTPGQIILAWHVRNGLVAVPKSGNAQRQAENLDVFDVPLTDDDMAALSALKADESKIMDSDRFGH